MSSILLNPFLWFALALTGWALWHVAHWIASGGRLPLRGHRGSASRFSAAGLAGQEFYQPGVKQAIEMQLRESMQREEDDQGDPPQPGVEAPHAR